MFSLFFNIMIFSSKLLILFETLMVQSSMFESPSRNTLKSIDLAGQDHSFSISFQVSDQSVTAAMLEAGQDSQFRAVSTDIAEAPCAGLKHPYTVADPESLYGCQSYSTALSPKSAAASGEARVGASCERDEPILTPGGGSMGSVAMETSSFSRPLVGWVCWVTAFAKYTGEQYSGQKRALLELMFLIR